MEDSKIKYEAKKLLKKFNDAFKIDINYNHKTHIENAKIASLFCIDASIEELKTCKTFYKGNNYYELRINYLNKIKEELHQL